MNIKSVWQHVAVAWLESPSSEPMEKRLLLNPDSQQEDTFGDASTYQVVKHLCVA